MLTGEIRNQIDRVIEQLTYLLFIKRLDEMHTLRGNKANRLKQSIENPIFGPEQQALRWSYFKNLEPRQMYDLIVDEVFPFMKGLGGEASAFAKHMKDARFTLPPEKAGLLTKAVDMLGYVPMEDRDTMGDLYEYMLSKLATTGQNGQFRTQRHIIKLMVAMVAPNRKTRSVTRPAARPVFWWPATNTCATITRESSPTRPGSRRKPPCWPSMMSLLTR